MDKMAEGGEVGTVKKKVHRYYVRNSIVPFEEDSTHEFKGHRNICVDELHSEYRHSKKKPRQTISKTMNAFINTVKGGTVYLGIVDDGTVKGFSLIEYQKDHILASIEDTFNRYNPPVEKHRYKVRFVPIVDGNATDDEIQQMMSAGKNAYIDPSLKNKPHTIRTRRYCWCDNEQIAMCNCGILFPDYVIEIIIKPWNPEDPRNEWAVGTRFKAPPIHENEEGEAFFRKQASVMSYTTSEIADLGRQRAREQYQPEIDRLKQRLYSLLETKVKKLKLQSQQKDA